MQSNPMEANREGLIVPPVLEDGRSRGCGFRMVKTIHSDASEKGEPARMETLSPMPLDPVRDPSSKCCALSKNMGVVFRLSSL